MTVVIVCGSSLVCVREARANFIYAFAYMLLCNQHDAIQTTMFLVSYLLYVLVPVSTISKKDCFQVRGRCLFKNYILLKLLQRKLPSKHVVHQLLRFCAGSRNVYKLPQLSRIERPPPKRKAMSSNLVGSATPCNPGDCKGLVIGRCAINKLFVPFIAKFAYPCQKSIVISGIFDIMFSSHQ